MAAPAHANHLALGSTIPTDAGGVRRTGDKGYKARSEGQLLCSGDDWGSSGGIILGFSILHFVSGFVSSGLEDSTSHAHLGKMVYTSV
jgi:hypothetical protein